MWDLLGGKTAPADCFGSVCEQSSLFFSSLGIGMSASIMRSQHGSVGSRAERASLPRTGMPSRPAAAAFAFACGDGEALSLADLSGRLETYPTSRQSSRRC